MSNYDEATVERMVTDYTAATTDEARATVVANLATDLGVSKPSVIAKLVHEGVYIAKTRKDTPRGRTKAEIVTALANRLNVDEDRVESLEKATKSALSIVEAALSRDE